MSKHIKYGLFQGKNLYRIPSSNKKSQAVKPNILTIYDKNDLYSKISDMINNIESFQKSSWLNSKEKKDSFNSLMIKELDYKTNKVRKIKLSNFINFYSFVDKDWQSIFMNTIFDIRNLEEFYMIEFNDKIINFNKFLKQSGIKENIIINSEYSKKTGNTKAIIDSINDELQFLLSLNYNDFFIKKINNKTYKQNGN